MKILLVNPPLDVGKVYKRFSKVGSNMPPMGLAYLAGYLRKFNKEVYILDAGGLRFTLGEMVKKIIKVNPDIVGFYTATPGVNMVKVAADEIKKIHPEILIIAGGPHFFGLTEETVLNSDLDLAAIGEGEETLLEIVNILERDGYKNFFVSLGSIRGIVYKKDGIAIRTEKRDYIKNLDGIPFPARDMLLPLEKYCPAAINYRRTPNTVLFTSRGCPYQCVFCASHTDRLVRFFSIERVISEIDFLVKEYGIRELTILDDTFTINKQRVLEMCKKIKERNYDLIWVANVRVNLVDREILESMKSAGCYMIMPGVESGNQEILNLIKKEIKLEQVIKLADWCKELKLLMKPSFIIGHPGETLETINQTINFAKNLYCHYPSFSLMTPYPGTDLWDMVSKYGKINVSNFDYYCPSASEAPFVPFGLSNEILIKKQKEGFKTCYLNPSMIWRHLRLLSSWEDLKRMYNAFITLFFKL